MYACTKEHLQEHLEYFCVCFMDPSQVVQEWDLWNGPDFVTHLNEINDIYITETISNLD